VRCNAVIDGSPEPAAAPPRRPPRPVMPPPRPLPPPKKGGGGKAALVISLVLVLATAAALAVFYVKMVKPKSEGLPNQAELKRRLTTQPDFRGDAEFVEGKDEYSGVIARKGGQFMMGIQFARALLLKDPSRSGKTPINAIFTPGKPVVVVIPEIRAYVEVPPGTQGLPKEDPLSQVFTIVNEEQCEVEEYGPSTVGEYQVVKYRLKARDGSRNPGYVCLAPSLQNLIVEVDLGPDWTIFKGKLKYTIKNAALEVDSDLFRVPATYNRVN
jgi:hypothetical protein